MNPFLIQHYVDISVNHSSNKIALTSPGENYTYRSIWQISNKIGNLLIDNQLRRQQRVAIYLKRSPKSIIAMLGILKGDGIYVVVDGKSPAQRLKLVTDDCQSTFIICDNSNIGRVKEVLATFESIPKIIILEQEEEVSARLETEVFFQEQIDQQVENQPDYKNIDTDIAQIIYTSGSTGHPKGVMISHLNITNYINWAVEEFEITANDVILGTAPFHFDMSTFDIFCSLKAGCKFCIAPDTYLLFPKNSSI